MSKYKFSIIVTTCRDAKALEPLFRKSEDNAELIITDSGYNEYTKKWLEKTTGYERIIYAPVERARFKYSKDCILGMNLAFMYAENYWLIRGDDSLEFKPDFFEKCDEDIDYFSESLGTKKFGVVGQKLWGVQNQLKWTNYCQSYPTRYMSITDPAFTFSFGILPIEMIYDLNGYNELYDHGWGFEEQDFLLRGMLSGYKYIFDKEMMGYSEPHVTTLDSSCVNRFIWELQRPEILCGKLRAFNAYDIRTAQSYMLAKKDEYTIKR